jgi:hypothetical protein
MLSQLMKLVKLTRKLRITESSSTPCSHIFSSLHGSFVATPMQFDRTEKMSIFPDLRMDKRPESRDRAGRLLVELTWSVSTHDSALCLGLFPEQICTRVGMFPLVKWHPTGSTTS